MKRKKRSISDKERLDALQTWLLNGSYEHEDIWVSRHLGWVKTIDGPLHVIGQRDLRQAIDAAIRAERASRKESK